MAKKSMELFKKALIKVAKEAGVEPESVTAVQFKALSDFPEWDLRKLGGFRNVVGLLYPGTTSAHLQGMAYVKSFIKSRSKKDSMDEFLKDEFLDVFKELLPKAGLKVHAPFKLKQPSVKSKSRTIVAHVSDTHFGANIQSTEMGGVNAFNWEVAARRMAMFADQIVNYKLQYRKDTELVIAVNGDIIAGVIHDQTWFADLLTKQAAGTIKILTQFVSYCAQHFDKVRVVMTAGNHGRAMHKSSHNRATTHKWDSYETMIYLAVRESLKQHKNVACEIPETPYAILDIQGHKFFQTHGDTVVNVGNPGTSINMKSINTQINRLNASALAEQKFAGILVGHVHVATVQVGDNGTMLLINGTLSGADPYCQSIGIMSNEPTQMLFEVTKEHAVGDIRFIKLIGADSVSSLEKIIEPLKGNLD